MIAAFLLLLLALGAPPAPADSLVVTEPFPGTCLTGPGARYAVSGGGVRPVRGEFSMSAHGVPPLAPRFALDARGAPGGLLRLVVAPGAPVEAVSATLATASGRVVSRGAGFRMRRGDADSAAWCVLLGIPAGAVPGAHVLALVAEAPDRRWTLVRDFAVEERSYPTERVALTRELTDLRTSTDPRRTVEAQALAAVLGSAHPDAVWEPGTLVDPLPGTRRTSGYGDRRIYEYDGGGTDVSVHLGIDIASPQGTPVPASGRGRVVLARSRLLTGNTVVVEHLPGLFSLYYHLASIRVAEGDVVERGALLGTVGMTGLATGSHLHWQVQAGGVAVDPDALAAVPLLDTGPAFEDSFLLHDEGR